MTIKNRILIISVFITCLMLSYSCRRSKEAEETFKKIGNFELFGMKFGVDSKSIKKTDSKKQPESILEMLAPAKDKANSISLEQSLVDITKKISPRVVNIKVELSAKRVLEKLQKIIPDADSKFLDNTKNDTKSKVIERFKRGSGFLVSWDGLIVTLASLVKDAQSIQVLLPERKGEPYSAKIIGLDQQTNIAVIKIEVDKALNPVQFGDSNSLRIGQMLVSIGNPLGTNHTVVSGIVSGVPRASLSLADPEDYIQTSTPIYKGSSGGPLVTLDGLVVGMNGNPQVSSDPGFVIPSYLLKHIINQLVKNGRVIRSWLGAGTQDLSIELAKSFEFKHVGAYVIVNDVVNDSPAMRAGIKISDIILEVNSERIENEAHLNRVISMLPFGSKAVFRMWRDGDIISKTVKFKLEKKNEVDSETQIYKEPVWTGLEVGVKPIIKEDGKTIEQVVFVHTVPKLSPGDKAGIKGNDIILKINGKKIKNYDEYKKELQEPENNQEIRVLIRRKHGYVYKNLFVVLKKSVESI